MIIHLILSFFYVGAIVGPIAGIILLLLLRSPRRKKIARFIFVVGTVPLGATCGFFMFVIPADAGWFGSHYQGEAGFGALLLMTCLGAAVVPTYAYKWSKRLLHPDAQQGVRQALHLSRTETKRARR